MSVEQLARKHGLTVHALMKRIQRGTPLDKPLQRRTKRERPLSIAEQARKHGLPYEVAKKRLERGMALDAPHTEKKQRIRFSPLVWTPDPLNAVCNAWRTPTTLAALGVRHNLRWRL